MDIGIANPRWRGNVPGIPGACATRNFTYLTRGSWDSYHHYAWWCQEHIKKSMVYQFVYYRCKIYNSTINVIGPQSLKRKERRPVIKNCLFNVDVRFKSYPTLYIMISLKETVFRKTKSMSWYDMTNVFYITLTHWGRVTHICVSKLTIIGSDNGLSPARRQAIILTNAGILLIGPLGTNFSGI